MKKKILTVAIIVCILLLGAWWVFSVVMYNLNINQRFETYEPLMFRVEDFVGLERTRYTFPSNKGQMLTGYVYSIGDDQQKRGIIVCAHGLGGGHNSYMDCIHYFAQAGYYVFAYDATGNDESEGKGVGGLPQGVVDLDHALSFIQSLPEYKDFPIGLFGHSWGAYSVCTVLTFHPEVRAVIAACGSNSSSDLFEAGGKRMAGDGIYAMMPFVKLHEQVQYGKYATSTAMDGFEASKAHVMITHSADDDVVPISYGYERYYMQYKDNPRFTFLHFDDRGHGDFFVDPLDTCKDEFNETFYDWRETLGYDYNAKENKERFEQDRADYIRKNLDRAKWAHRLDEKLFEQFVQFYDEYVKP